MIDLRCLAGLESGVKRFLECLAVMMLMLLMMTVFVIEAVGIETAPQTFGTSALIGERHTGGQSRRCDNN